MYLLFTKQLRDSGLLADVLMGKLNKDTSFALRRGTIAQVTTALDAAQRAVEDESPSRRGGLGSLDSLLFLLHLRRRFCPFFTLLMTAVDLLPAWTVASLRR